MCFTTASWANIGKIYYAVPRKIAAAAGFKDDFIYKDLKKPLEKRKTAVIYVPVFRKTGEAIFRQWKKQGGKLY
jgi:tRNA(Arg) A34 adenosine deaminase TadA